MAALPFEGCGDILIKGARVRGMGLSDSSRPSDVDCMPMLTCCAADLDAIAGKGFSEAQKRTLCNRRLQLLVLKRQARALRSNVAATRALGVAARNECIKFDRLQRCIALSSRAGLEVFELRQDDWDARIYKELQLMAREQGIPIHSQSRSPTATPTPSKDLRYEQRFLYDSDDLLNSMKAISADLMSTEREGVPVRKRCWALLQLGLETESMDDLRRRFAELHPNVAQFGVDDDDEAFDREHQVLGNKLARVGSVELIEKYLRQGCSPSLRPRLYNCVLQSSSRNVFIAGGTGTSAGVVAGTGPRTGTGIGTDIGIGNGGCPQRDDNDFKQQWQELTEERVDYKPPTFVNAAGTARPKTSGRIRPGTGRSSSKDKGKKGKTQGRPSTASRVRSSVGTRSTDTNSNTTCAAFINNEESFDICDDPMDDGFIDSQNKTTTISNNNINKTIKTYDKTVVDRLHALDLELIRNNDNYFVFEELLRNILPRLFNEHMEWLRIHSRVVSRLEHIRAVPYYGFALKVAPLAYVYKREDEIVLALREMFARYWCQLNVLRTYPKSSGLEPLPNLCAQFEDLVLLVCPEVVYHMLSLGVKPLEIAFPWIHLAFSSALAVEELLLLWDRILGFDSLLLLPVLAAAIFKYRSRAVLVATNARELQKLMSQTKHLNITALLQAFLFT